LERFRRQKTDRATDTNKEHRPTW